MQHNLLKLNLVTQIVCIVSKNIWYFTTFSNMCLFRAPFLNFECFLSGITTKIEILHHILLKLNLLNQIIRIVLESIWYYTHFLNIYLFCAPSLNIERFLSKIKTKITIFQHNLLKLNLVTQIVCIVKKHLVFHNFFKYVPVLCSIP